MKMNLTKQRQFDEKYLRMAKIWSENSHANRRKVGCLIVKDNMIISDGYNGTPSGFENECEYIKPYKDECGCCSHGTMCERGDNYGKKCDNCGGKYDTLVTKPYVLHAEANAITKLAKSGNSSEGATLYVTLSPCIECAKLMIQSGIKRVVYMEEYRITDGLDLLKRAGIDVERIEI